MEAGTRAAGGYIYPNGDYYEGGFDSGIKSGNGVFKRNDERFSYIGTWENDKMHGNGKETLGDGSCMTASFGTGKARQRTVPVDRRQHIHWRHCIWTAGRGWRVPVVRRQEI